jgi:hypothetical protein
MGLESDAIGGDGKVAVHAADGKTKVGQGPAPAMDSWLPLLLCLSELRAAGICLRIYYNMVVVCMHSFLAKILCYLHSGFSFFAQRH